MKQVNTQKVGGSNATGIAQYNERLVLQLIRKAGSLTKTEIAQITQLSSQAASVIINRLLEKELLCKQKRRNKAGKVGQPAIPIALNPTGKYSLGIKVGRRSLDIVLINFIGEIIQQYTFDYDYPNPDFIFPTIEEYTGSIIKSLTPDQLNNLLGIGVAAPYDLGGWQQEANIPTDITSKWNKIDIKDTIQKNHSIPVWLVNDATAASIASLEFGEHKQFNNYFYLFIGTFVGGGIIMNRTLYCGSNNNAGAIGSMLVPKINDNTHSNNNGEMVQLIQCASRYLLNEKLSKLGGNIDEILATIAEDSIPTSHEEANRLFEQWSDQAARGIAYAITATASILDVEGIVIDGILPEKLTKRLTEKVETAIETLNLAGITKPEISASTLGNDARALGGAFLPFYTNFAPDRNILISGSSNVSDAFQQKYR